MRAACENSNEGLTSGALQGKRVFFSADAKLPKNTPETIAELRRLELLAIQVKTCPNLKCGLFPPGFKGEVPRRLCLHHGKITGMTSKYG